MNNLPQSVIKVLSAREHRLRHLLWHSVRQVWLFMNKEQQADFEKRFPKWVPPRPAIGEHGELLTQNGSGEDFLYAHRKMIEWVNSLLRHENHEPVRGWDRFPANSEEAVPIWNGMDKEVRMVKDTWFWELLDRESGRVRDPAVLNGMTLWELGAIVEFGIHNAMHLRFGHMPKGGLRMHDPHLKQPIQAKFDDPIYNTLLDMYSAHVNPLFWRIHGWVDDCVENWKIANKIGHYEWKYTWTGPMDHDDHPDHPHPIESGGEVSAINDLQVAIGVVTSVVDPERADILAPRIPPFGDYRTVRHPPPT